jgi:ferredoxin/flavodoxin---NADP+ reductase
VTTALECGVLASFMPKTDVLVIGAGPVGLFAAFYVGMRDLSMRVLDALPEPGGQLTALYPEKYIYDVAGYPKVRAKELVKNQLEQLAPFHPVYTLGERAEKLEKIDSGFRVITDKGSELLASSVIIAGGVGAFEPRRLVAPGVSDFEGKGVQYAVKNLESYRNKNVLVVGGGDSAVDWVLMLKDVAKTVTLIHRRDSFRAHAATTNQMIAASDAGEIKILTPYELRRLEGEGGKLQRAVVYHNGTNIDETLEVDAVLSMVGYLSKLGPIAEWGLELEGNRIKVSQVMETNIPGVFSCGDICVYPGKLKLIATGYGEAAIAANHAAVIANPALKVEPGHSSEAKDAPGTKPAVAPVQ